jgi:hypothetical protein
MKRFGRFEAICTQESKTNLRARNIMKALLRPAVLSVAAGLIFLRARSQLS